MSILQTYLRENRELFDIDPLSHDHGLLGIQATLPPLMSFIRKYNHMYDVSAFTYITEAQVEMGIRSIKKYKGIPEIDHTLLLYPEIDGQTLYTWTKLFSFILAYNQNHQTIHKTYLNHLWYFLPHFCIQPPIRIGGYTPKHFLPDSVWLLLNHVVSNTLYNTNNYASDTRLTEHFLAISKYFEDDIWHVSNMCMYCAFYYLQKIGIICLMARVFDTPNLDVSFKNEIYNHLIRIIPSM